MCSMSNNYFKYSFIYTPVISSVMSHSIVSIFKTCQFFQKIYVHVWKLYAAFPSTVGHCSMIGAQTGKVLDCEVRIKSCRICEHAKREKNQPKDHNCRQNWQGIVNCFTCIGLKIQLSLCLSRVVPL